ncbi:hypothetical protein [[Eubacterium] cellulosolvens]
MLKKQSIADSVSNTMPNTTLHKLSKEDRANRYNLYFIIRSMITGSMGFFTFSIIVSLLGNLKGVEAIIISFFSFAYPVILTKLFHENIKRLVERTFLFLERHKKIKKLIILILK